ncbi:MAG: hypothetical protein JNK14_19645 [Chitinophagaceae bacterium]|nr:hypothetical protein [Chitinophagaceae bacterium]
MRNRNTIRSLLLAAVIALSFLALWAASPVKGQNSCKESMEGCCKKTSDDNSDKMSWETLPHRFFSSL